MKQLLTTLFLLCFVYFSPLNSQTIVESLINFKNSYCKANITQTGKLSMDLVMKYEPSQTDTAYFVTITFNDSGSELNKFPLSSTNYGIRNNDFNPYDGFSFNRKIDAIQLDYDQFIEFYNCVTKVFNFIKEYKNNKKTDNNTMAICSYENFDIVGEFDPFPLIDDSQFLIQRKGDTAYEINQIQFSDFIKNLNEVKKKWKSIRS